MEKKVIKKILALLMIITILTTDFFVLGSNLITYASQNNSETNNSNIEFSAYFKNDKGEELDSIDKSIKTEDLKLYAEIKVKNEGYFNGTIEITDSNFNVKDEILSTQIASIENNKITLKQINAGETVEVELGIEPILSDKMTADMLSKTSTVKISGTYMESTYEGLPIEAEKLVNVNYQVDETAKPEIETDIITNQVFSVNGTDKRIVQLLIKSRLSENQYPVEKTTLSVNIPQLGKTEPEAKVLAANGRTNISDYKAEKGKVIISLNNNVDGNNQINWYKNGYDEVVVTLIYEADVDTSTVEITTNLDINVYNSNKTYKTEHSTENANTGLINTVLANPEFTTTELYKGQLYANTVAQEKKNVSYNKTTTLVVTDKDLANEITIYESLDEFVLTNDTTLDTDSKYESTEINKQQMLEILGNSGSIAIKNGDKTLAEITNISEIESENIVVNYEEPAGELQIVTSKPVSEGILELKHTKSMTENNYSREQINTIKGVKTESCAQGTSSAEKPAEAKLELKETVSKAELTIENNKHIFSTTEPNEMILGVTLITENTQYDLYKDPTITIQLPSDVEKIELLSELTKIHANEFEIVSAKYDTENKTITINTKGEQTIYPESSATQAYFQLNLKITLSQLAIARTDAITMTYTNGNDVQYYNEGISQQKVEISAPSEVITVFNLSSSEDDSLTETLLQRIQKNDSGKTLDLKMLLVNNEDTDLNDVKILGKLPTAENVIAGEDANTLETILKSIDAPNATVYYTENINATVDIDKEENGWTTDLSALTNAKLYLIEMDSFAKGATYEATIKIRIPKAITENAISYTQYEVIYDTQTETGATKTSRKIGLMSSIAAAIKTEVTAQVGQDELKNGDSVKEGEVIRYKVTVKNNGTTTLQNTTLSLDVPEGTVFVRPIPREFDELGDVIGGSGYVYADNAYYEEITDAEKLAELTNITIPELSTTTPYTVEYEVRVNKGSAGTQISNKSSVIYDSYKIESTEFKNTIRQSNIRVTIKRLVDESVQLVSGGATEYMVYVENLSNSSINNLEIQLLVAGFEMKKVEKVPIEPDAKEISINNENKISIEKIEPNGIASYSIYGLIEEDLTEVGISAIVTDSTGNKYRSNSLTEWLPKMSTTISLTSPQNGNYIKEGDIVKYTIKATYTGEIDGYTIVKDTIPEYLQVQSVSVNGVETLQCLDKTNTETYTEAIANDIREGTTLKSGESIQIDITAKVGYIPELYHGKVISSYATVDVNSVYSNSSQVVTHILKANVSEDVKNVITGLAWFDENENGKKEADEKVLSNIKVKIYDLSTKNYLLEDMGGILQTETDSNGQYSFTKIGNGSYLVVFEYDTDNYEPTTSFAEGVDSSINSKATLQRISVNGQKITVSAIQINNLSGNVCTMNIGLKEGKVDALPEDDPENPSNPENPGENENPENPGGEGGSSTEQEKGKHTISGLAWLDSNRNGQKDAGESTFAGIKVKIYNVLTNNYVVDANGNIVQQVTDNNGKYEFSNIEKGSYILIFEYDTEKYLPTIYMAEGVDTTVNSKVVLKTININNQDITTAVTDLINVQNNVTNINIGLKENLVFDLELNKYISRIVVQNGKGTKAYDYESSTFEKVEIHRKQIQGSIVVLEYTIKVKNTGEISGNARNIVDYLPSGLTFSSELNTDWYLSGNNLYTKSLENVELNPGEEKEIKLILTKTMTNENVGLINNRAEIYQDYNKYGESDNDSTPNNQIQEEDDFAVADVIIAVSTGGSTFAYIILLTINMILIGIAIKLMIKNRIIKISTKRERR